MSVQNWNEELDKFSPFHSKISKMCALMSCLWPNYKMFELIKCRGVILDDTKNWFNSLTCAFKNDMKNLANFHNLKNSNCKMAEINQNKNSKQTNRPAAAWKLYFSLE